ncbi:MAG: 2-amino-4-hydroxy-6-hydroxymethyldihydropteridine diphosphokinase [Bacillota bacterium]|jgi:2-amino-4-hydroxy-6-hydroxymethyldihydropteridine diphosphokinase
MSNKGVRCFIGIGSNLGDMEENIRQSLVLLARDERLKLIRLAPLYRTEPMGFVYQDWFLNTVLELEAKLRPADLLYLLQDIEDRMGRLRTIHWGPRVIDLDILWYDGQVVNEPDLVIPHPEMQRRAFVMVPLADLEPDLELAGGKRAAELAAQLSSEQKIIPAGKLDLT